MDDLARPGGVATDLTPHKVTSVECARGGAGVIQVILIICDSQQQLN